MKKVETVTVDLKRKTLKLTMKGEISRLGFNGDISDWWQEFEGIGDLNLWTDDETEEVKVAIYPDSDNHCDWYNPELIIKN